MKILLYLVRHGSTEFNVPEQRKLRGWMDVPLSEMGKRDLEEAITLLTGKPVSSVIASDLSRASSSGRIIASRLGLSFSKDPALRPWNTGSLDGNKMDDIKADMEFYMHNPTKPVPGGESFNKFTSRLKGVIEKYLDYSKLHKPLVLVTSHSDLLALPTILWGKKPDTITDGPPFPGEVIGIGDDMNVYEICDEEEPAPFFHNSEGQNA